MDFTSWGPVQWVGFASMAVAMIGGGAFWADLVGSTAAVSIASGSALLSSLLAILAGGKSSTPAA